MQKKFLILGAVLLISLGFLSYGLKQGNKKQEVPPQGLAVFFFYSDSCPYCAKMKPFLEDLAQENEKIVLNEIKVSTKQGSQQLLGFYEQYEVPKDAFGSVPIVFIKDKYFIGYSESNNEAIADYLAGVTFEQLEEKNTFANDETEQVEKGYVKIPFLGEIDPSKYSLGVLAIILGFFDGFNVCSLGALVLILGMVLVLKSRKKILFFGGVYIIATALVYGVLILLWYKLFVFLAPFLQIMEVLVGLLGVIGGIYFLQDFFEFRKKGAQCTSKNNRVMKRLSERIQKVLKSEKKSILAIGISVLAFSVIITVVEFPCSAVVPLFFAGSLAEANLGALQYLLYIALFVLFYMADEIIIFLLVAFTMTIKLASQKFVVWITLIEAVVLFLLGFYYLFGFLIF
ncbi:hypothetical protein COX24_01990 [bacterium (Candidatus Gribaldobacteria) CG23_combo_of_CG06-09_8_20_14_all_37_87_8]|uniref:Uncharacterized protein n=2 Tax=Candidatus Gribaldobacteria TaxID=2798536 RepID=A0A2G9ZHA9_9BACT|nr:MAG: hypothetical protein AUJ25_00470 [Parcubacteria group bacterium CG1_02_37_13]PIP31728.1 MAG: hypothetical protein COX24_01990 [bacterium (Candidatus Gribaldobacteria) CG23_combo_of_CG06-09_8_20_14_all_37_87_8]PIR90610.1 MAG: hypothetical protein COU05_01140 [bacterium (Candidatus Gribaldobacteria) CG10_big_fil_rev_8_21_14_0_10_37_21]